MLTPREKKDFDAWLDEKYTETHTNRSFIFEEIKNYTDDYSRFIVTKFLESAYQRGMKTAENRFLHGLEVDKSTQL